VQRLRDEYFSLDDRDYFRNKVRPYGSGTEWDEVWSSYHWGLSRRCDARSPQFGDVNCDGSVDGGDTVAILQFAVHVAIKPPQHAGCTPIGETLP
jgi:hypothetical protein